MSSDALRAIRNSLTEKCLVPARFRQIVSNLGLTQHVGVARSDSDSTQSDVLPTRLKAEQLSSVTFYIDTKLVEARGLAVHCGLRLMSTSGFNKIGGSIGWSKDDPSKLVVCIAHTLNVERLKSAQAEMERAVDGKTAHTCYSAPGHTVQCHKWILHGDPKRVASEEEAELIRSNGDFRGK